jgi:hypothetical protein
MKLVWFDRIDAIEEREVVVSGRKAADGKEAELVRASEGWWITCGLISYNVGMEKPPFTKGDKIKHTMEKVDEN